MKTILYILFLILSWNGFTQNHLNIHLNKSGNYLITIDSTVQGNMLMNSDSIYSIKSKHNLSVELSDNSSFIKYDLDVNQLNNGDTIYLEIFPVRQIDSVTISSNCPRYHDTTYVQYKNKDAKEYGKKKPVQVNSNFHPFTFYEIEELSFESGSCKNKTGYQKVIKSSILILTNKFEFD